MLALVRRYWPGWEVVRFGITGILATLTHYLVLVASVELLGLSPVISNGLAFCVAVGVTYAGQSLWVFKVSHHSWGQVRKFIFTAVAGFLANIGLMAALHSGLSIDYQIAFVIILIIVPLCTYLANKYWVFARGSMDHGKA